MKLVFTLLLIVSFPAINAQADYSYTDSKALQIPKTKTYTAVSIAEYIVDNFKTDKEKIRAVYTWVINNIQYSKDSMHQFNRWGIDPDINLNAILRRRKGVCENYAALFAGILQKCNLQAVVVTGYTNLPRNNYWNGHGWVAVMADSAWYLCDPTWDSGNNTYTYFLVAPEEFIQTHMPFDPLWQLLEHPITHKDFIHGHFSITKSDPFFNYRDSVTAYLQSDTLQQMESTSRRIAQSGFDNEDVKTWYSYNQMKVHIVLQEENMKLFNDAVDLLNKAKKLYNEFVQYRNNNFSPAQPIAEINTLFSSARKNIQSAYQKLALVGKKTENYQYDTESLQANLESLAEKIKMQQEFWEQHLKEPEAATKKLL